MTSAHRLALLLAPAVVAVSTAAHADFLEPVRAKRIATSFVTAYAPCTSPNDSTTGSIQLPACHPATRSDAGCGFGTRGSGQGRAQVVGQREGLQDIRISGQLGGLDPSCEGETLCLTASLIVTTGGCQSGDPAGCTMQTLTDFPIGVPPTSGCAVVKNGTARLSAGVNSAFGAPVLNSRTGIEILGVAVKRVSSVNSPAPAGNTFRSGLLLDR